MIFTEIKIKGAYRISLELIEDNRGFFARSFCQQEFGRYGLNRHIVQCNISYNKVRGTLRGMHLQEAPHEEAKLVSCLKGVIFDVIIDLRPASPTYCEWASVEMCSPHELLYIPEGCAHGFQTMEAETEVFYQMFQYYHPESSRGVRWNDPLFNISWPLPPSVISDKDLTYPDFHR